MTTRQAAPCETLLVSTSAWPMHSDVSQSNGQALPCCQFRYLECSTGRQVKAATALPVCSIRMGLRRSQVADLWASCQKTMLASLADEARFSILCASQVPQREPRQLAPVSSITACRWGLTCVPIVRDQGRFAQISAGLSNTSLAGVRASRKVVLPPSGLSRHIQATDFALQSPPRTCCGVVCNPIFSGAT